jgi:transcriptional regulator with XRE-family HTH domain
VGNVKQKERMFLRLRGEIIANGYNLKSFAYAMGITQQALNEKLQGRSDFTLKEMINACNLLNTSNIELFFEPKLHNLQFLKNKTA